MKRLLFLAILFALLLPTFSQAMNYAEMKAALQKLETHQLDVFAMTLQEYVAFYHEHYPADPQITQWAVKRYASEVHAQFTIYRKRIEMKIKAEKSTLFSKLPIHVFRLSAVSL